MQELVSSTVLQLCISTSALEWNARPVGDLPWQRGVPMLGESGGPSPYEVLSKALISDF